MFKKKNKEAVVTVPENGAQTNCTVITETIEDEDGVRTITKKYTTSSSSSSGAEVTKIFEDLKVGESSVITRKIVSTNSTADNIFEKNLEHFSQKRNYADLLDGTKSTKEIQDAPKSKSQPKIDKEASKKSSSSTKPGEFEEKCLKSHNSYRAKHGVPNLKLSKELCAYAQEWANELAATESFQHRQQKKYGENIYTKWTSDPNYMVTGEEAVDSWYSEIKDHVFGREPTSLKSGHFTQVIWRESKELGVAWSKSKKGHFLVVANYNPPGNFVGKFAENVPPPKK